MTQTLLKHWLATKSRLVIDCAAINFHFSAVRIPLELPTSVVSLPLVARARAFGQCNTHNSRRACPCFVGTTFVAVRAFVGAAQEVPLMSLVWECGVARLPLVDLVL